MKNVFYNIIIVFSNPLPPEYRKIIEEEKNEIYLYPSNEINGRKIIEYIGCLNLHLIRESKLLSSSDASDFYHLFFFEVMQTVHAHINNVGGNAVLCFNIEIDECGNDKTEESVYILIILNRVILQ